ncbi:MAG: TlpA family protein disulfide reductase [Phycisphaerales bacterium]|nr:MAG: TlpA family protein disulfide reductase [Phycisphaerales bacterium]
MRLWVLMVGLLMGSGSSAAVPDAGVGDAAPKLSVEKWVHGAASDPTAGGRIHVVNFFAAHCQPCEQLSPFLTEIQHRFIEHVVVIGVAAPELRTTPSTEIEDWVARQGDALDYRVAWDGDGSAFRTYMTGGTHLQRIPYAFVVDAQGKIAWRGMPQPDELVGAVTRLLPDSFDPRRAERIEEARGRVGQYRELARSDTFDAAKAAELGEQIMKGASDSQVIMQIFATVIMSIEDDARRDAALGLRTAKASYDFGGAEDPALLMVYARALFETGDAQEAVTIQRRVMTMVKDVKLRTEAKKALDEYYQATRKK